MTAKYSMGKWLPVFIFGIGAGWFVPTDAAEALQLAQASRLFGDAESRLMQIDLLPGSGENRVNPKAGRVIPVAIMGSAVFDVGAINPRTIRIKGVDVMLVGKSDKSLCRQLDIDADSHMDLLCDLRTTGFRVAAGSYKILLEAETYDKVSLRGEDQIIIVRN